MTSSGNVKRLSMPCVCFGCCKKYHRPSSLETILSLGAGGLEVQYQVSGERSGEKSFLVHSPLAASFFGRRAERDALELFYMSTGPFMRATPSEPNL